MSSAHKDHTLVPEAVRLRALSTGEAGTAWLAGLEQTVAELAQRWHLSIGRTLSGGTESFVAEATMRDGRAAVLKIRPPASTTTVAEFQTLLAARGRGYADVYQHDASRGALLLERLGPPLADLDVTVDRKLELLCETLIQAWAPPPPGASFMNGAQKASSLSEFIASTWQELGRPCSEQVIETAHRYTEARRRSFDAQTAVLGHGDAHQWNALQLPGTSETRFKFVDPEGLFIERAYDLGIAMREWTDELLTGDAATLGIERSHRLAKLTGIEPESIWQWGFIERTSTGLHAMQIGLAGGREMLAVAEQWAQHAASTRQRR